MGRRAQRIDKRTVLLCGLEGAIRVMGYPGMRCRKCRSRGIRMSAACKAPKPPDQPHTADTDHARSKGNIKDQDVHVQVLEIRSTPLKQKRCSHSCK